MILIAACMAQLRLLKTCNTLWPKLQKFALHLLPLYSEHSTTLHCKKKTFMVSTQLLYTIKNTLHCLKNFYGETQLLYTVKNTFMVQALNYYTLYSIHSLKITLW